MPKRQVTRLDSGTPLQRDVELTTDESFSEIFESLFEIASLAYSAGGGASGSGVAEIDFGAFPGDMDASLDVTGEPSIGAGSIVKAWLYPKDTTDHTLDEHRIEEIKIFAGNIVAGTGFTIYAQSTGTDRLYGLWSVAWEWSG